ncbi:MAG: YesL family protein [Lachnospiraceae bacterium]|nr:YesL family protein [Lachnospiraceae bacterium]
MSKFFNLDSPFMVGLTKVADLMIVNFLALLCCIPIFTIGASMTALHYVCLKIVRNEENYITRMFFKSFKENFKQATIIWLIEVVVIGLFGLDLWILGHTEANYPDWFRTALLAMGFLVFALSLYTFPLLAKFDNPVKVTIKNSALVSLMIWPKTIISMICWAIPIVIVFYAPQILPIDFCFGLSGPVFLCAILYNKPFKKLEPDSEEKNADDWTVSPIEEIEGTDTEMIEDSASSLSEENDDNIGEG